MSIRDAERIAIVAHTACGQFRADGVTPYWKHPERVVTLTHLLNGYPPERADYQAGIDRLVAAWLHDVLEDTKLTAADLLSFGIADRQLEIVKLLTKPHEGPSPPEYYAAIAQDPDALVVKCADRCANLEDSLKELEVEEPTTPRRRWGRYVEKTVTDVLPMYERYPQLLYELSWRLDAIESALPLALERRQKIIVDAQRAAAEHRKTQRVIRSFSATALRGERFDTVIIDEVSNHARGFEL